MKQKITIKTIAKELGVSTSTVSKALRDSYEISEETKKMVKAYADMYNYRPNKLALQLRNQKTKVIGVIIPKIVHHFFSNVVKGIEKGATERGYNLMVCFSDESHQKEVETINVLSSGSVDGLIMSVANESFKHNKFNHIEELVKEEIPLVMFDRVVNSIFCDKVIVDDFGAGFKAAKHLIDSGKSKIAMITTPGHVKIGKLRQQGYEKAIEESGLPLYRDLIFSIDDTLDIKEQIQLLFEKEFDAVFAVNEIFAALAIRIAKEKGLRVPEDISIVGFTDGLISEYATPSITTIDQHGFTMGLQAVDMLIERIENNGEVLSPRTKVVSCNLHIRESG